MERPVRSVGPRRPRWNTRRCRWTMRIVCPHWERSSRYVDNVEKFLSQGVAFGIRHERRAVDQPYELAPFHGFSRKPTIIRPPAFANARNPLITGSPWRAA